MFQIVYASTAVKMFSDSELLSQLNHYREKNARLGITGLLLYKNGSFMQALEGEQETVCSLYEVIRRDERHHHILTLLMLPVAARQFPNWSMGFKDLCGIDITAVPGYNSAPNLPPPDSELSWQASVAKSLLSTFQEDN